MPNFGRRSWQQVFQVTPCTVVNDQWFSAHVCRVDSMPLSQKKFFSVGETEVDMHCSVKCPGRPPLVSFSWRPPYETFWYQTSFWCNYWGLTLTLQRGNVIPFPVHHCKLHCMLMVLQSKHKAFLLCICTWVKFIFSISFCIWRESLMLWRHTSVTSARCWIIIWENDIILPDQTPQTKIISVTGLLDFTFTQGLCESVTASQPPTNQKKKSICTIELKYTPTQSNPNIMCEL